MQITETEWKKYQDLMARISRTAADEFERFAYETKGNRQEILNFANAMVKKYGETSGDAACKIYEQIARAQNANIQAPVMADIPEFGEVAKAVNGAAKRSWKEAAGAVQRITKQVGTDTIMQNAVRDKAYFAWVPSGDETCPYCIMLAATGWHKAGKNTLQGKYVGHVHANCDCQYVIDFKGDLKIEGYDPEALNREIMDCFNGEVDAEDLLNSTWSSKRGKASYETFNQFRRFKAEQRRILDGIADKFGEFTQESVKRHLDEMNVDWLKLLSDEQKKYIKKYTKNPGDIKGERLYERLNKALRTKDHSDEHLMKISEIISDGLIKFTLDENIICYRRTNEDFFSEYKLLQKFVMRQYTSTSVDIDGTLKGDVLTVFYVNKGTAGAYLGDFSDFPKQKEFLIDKDTPARVVLRKDGITFVEVF